MGGFVFDLVVDGVNVVEVCRGLEGHDKLSVESVRSNDSDITSSDAEAISLCFIIPEFAQLDWGLKANSKEWVMIVEGFDCRRERGWSVIAGSVSRFGNEEEEPKGEDEEVEGEAAAEEGELFLVNETFRLFLEKELEDASSTWSKQL